LRGYRVPHGGEVGRMSAGNRLVVRDAVVAFEDENTVVIKGLRRLIVNNQASPVEGVPLRTDETQPEGDGSFRHGGSGEKRGRE